MPRVSRSHPIESASCNGNLSQATDRGSQGALLDSPRDRFERVVMRHLDSAYNLAFWLLRNEQDAEDATQSALFKAFRAFAKMRAPDPKPWFLAIVRNECMDMLQARTNRAKRESPVLEEFEVPDTRTVSPEVALMISLDAELVRDSIDRLPTEFREVILLREVEELSYLEIAEVINKPIGTVMSRLARARYRLHVMLNTEVKP